MFYSGDPIPRYLPRLVSPKTCTTSSFNRCVNSSTPQPPSTGKPNLTITKLTIVNDGKTYDYFKSQKPTIVKDKATNFNITFSNNGTADATSCEYRMFISPYNDLIPNYNQRLFNQIGSYNAGFLQPKKDKFEGRQYTFRANEGPLAMVNYGKYYIYIHIDPVDRVKESDERTIDNVWKFEITFQNKSSAKNTIAGNQNYYGAAINQSEPYLINVYDFTGQKIISKKVIDLKEENQFISELPKKAYIIKSENGDRKVSF